MQDKTVSEIYSIMEKYAKTKDQIQEKIRSKPRRAEFMKQYEKTRSDIILDVMKEIRDFIKDKGVRLQISEEIPHEVRLDILPATQDTMNHTTISFIPNEISLKVLVYVTVPSHESGMISNKLFGEYETSEITESFVENLILKIIKQSFG